jgi:hypothetical protein
MSQLLEQRIERARWLLQNVRHAAIATVNEDGSPHNSPVFFQYDKGLKYLYWGSSPEAQRSKNIARDGRIFAVIYEANEGGGLYIQGNEAHVLEGEELVQGLAVLNEFRVRRDKAPLGIDYYTGNSPQRMYRVTIQKLSVNISERDEHGNIIRDYRHEITREDLV